MMRIDMSYSSGGLHFAMRGVPAESDREAMSSLPPGWEERGPGHYILLRPRDEWQVTWQRGALSWQARRRNHDLPKAWNSFASLRDAMLFAEQYPFHQKNGK
jgi:hypothetical protein